MVEKKNEKLVFKRGEAEREVPGKNLWSKPYLTLTHAGRK